MSNVIGGGVAVHNNPIRGRILWQIFSKPYYSYLCECWCKTNYKLFIFLHLAIITIYGSDAQMMYFCMLGPNRSWWT